ncbi:MAG: rane protein [Burkholderiaceae bacterium]|nr:rane protein [Burkholderiaceae bacterium]
MISAAPVEVLDFWFGDGNGVDSRWFRRSDAFDREIAARFGAAVESALAGGPERWAETSDGALALILLLDQFTRNMYRGTARAFAGDAQALALSRRLVATGEHLQLPPLRRWFAYMPLEHAEDLALQAQCVQLFEALVADAGPHREALAGALDYARRHHDVIARFGRFPHRNAVLGRDSSAEEAAFLRQPGSGF